MELRNYQVEFVRHVHDALRQCNRVVAVAPTGSGKRIIGCWWLDQITKKDRRVGVITDRQILVRQMADECSKQGISYGVVMGNEPRNDEARVQVCSIQTLKSRKYQDLPECDWWIHDEAHKESAAIQTLYDLYPKAKCVGLTATPVGAQGRSLLGLYNRIVEPCKNTELIKSGWLLPTTVMAPSEPDVQGISISSSGEYSQDQLGQRVQECTVFADVFKWWEHHSDCQTIVFAPRVIYARGLAEQFTERGYPAEVIEAGTSTRDRKDIFQQFTDRVIRVLVSVDVLREGFDAPIASCGIDLQPNHQLRTYWQKIGRIKRPYENQEHAIWLDFAGNFWRFPHPDDDPEWPSGTATTQDVVKERREEKKEREPWSCPLCSYVLSPWERLVDGRCPQCQAKVGKPIKRIRMADGSLRTVSAKEKKKKQASEAQRVWDKCRYKAHYSRKTLDFARWLYHQETGTWPNANELKACPEPDSRDWKCKPASVYPWMQRG